MSTYYIVRQLVNDRIVFQADCKTEQEAVLLRSELEREFFRTDKVYQLGQFSRLAFQIERIKNSQLIRNIAKGA